MKLFPLIIALGLILVACGPRSPLPVAGYVDLADRQPIPTPEEIHGVPLRVAIAAVISPKGTIESYTTLLDYIGSTLDRPVELVQRRTYLEINDLIAKGEVDVAFVCTSAYVLGRAQSSLELLVAPQVKDQTVYHSYLIVPAGSQATSMVDLEGKVFAFTDPISLSGRMYPTYLIQKSGKDPEHFFSHTFFTYSHDDAIRAVANKVADGAAVDSLVYEFAIIQDPSLATRTRVIHVSPAFGIPPVVVSPHIRPQLKVELQDMFLNMANDPNGGEALKAIGVDRFVLLEDRAYDGARSLLQEIRQD